MKRLAPNAIIPTRGSASAAGFDLYASRATTVPARGKVMVDTDIAIALPQGTYGRVAPRSGLGEWLIRQGGRVSVSEQRDETGRSAW